MDVGNKRLLEVDDLWELEEKNLMGNMSSTFEFLFEQAKRNANITGHALPLL